MEISSHAFFQGRMMHKKWHPPATVTVAMDIPKTRMFQCQACWFTCIFCQIPTKWEDFLHRNSHSAFQVKHLVTRFQGWKMWISNRMFYPQPWWRVEPGWSYCGNFTKLRQWLCGWCFSVSKKNLNCYSPDPPDNRRWKKISTYMYWSEYNMLAPVVLVVPNVPPVASGNTAGLLPWSRRSTPLEPNQDDLQLGLDWFIWDLAELSYESYSLVDWWVCWSYYMLLLCYTLLYYSIYWALW